jgi:aminoglycoside phosphotransferase (APT) family kinase protein
MTFEAANSADPPGIDLARLTAWLDAEHPGLRTGKLRASVIAGGRSNLTYRLTDGNQDWALRRPPLGHVLPTAHDMGREYRVISALGKSAVPVPTAVALCVDRSVLGELFYLMSYVDGVVLDHPGRAPGNAAAARASSQLVQTLVSLHAVDPAAVGLADFGRPDGFRERQLQRWHKQFLASIPPDAAGGSLSEAVQRLEQDVVGALTQRLPSTGPVGIVHGDYRLTNVMFAPDLSKIVAVVDWEMATLGDPLTDVGLLYVYHHLASTTSVVMPDFPPDQGFMSADDMVAAYAAATGIDLSTLDWYIAFGYFKLSVIAAGIHARHLQGLTVGAGFEQFGPLVEGALDDARKLLAASVRKASGL